MKLLPVLLLLLCGSLVSACGDNSYRCRNPDKIVDEISQRTRKICESLNEEECWCVHQAEFYCSTSGDNIQKFKDMCEATGENWYSFLC
jgi:hypothetical protein